MLLLGTEPSSAHHPISAKFDDNKPVTLNGVVTLVDWRNPHVHVYMNVRAANDADNWAVELESPIDLQAQRLDSRIAEAGRRDHRRGISARNGSRQVWANKITLTGERQAGAATSRRRRPRRCSPIGRRRAGPTSSRGLVPPPGACRDTGRSRAPPCSSRATPTSRWISTGCCATSPTRRRWRPMQPWALALYSYRQRRFLQDDPTFLNCKPPGGPRQFQLSYGVQFVEDRERQRIFVLIGGGNNNFRIIYLDGRGHAGQVGGDDDNPLYYGRAVGKWEGDSLVVDTRGFNEDFWFTNGGLPHTDQLKLIERFTRENFDTLKYEVTVDDPGAYTQTVVEQLDAALGRRGRRCRGICVRRTGPEFANSRRNEMRAYILGGLVAVRRARWLPELRWPTIRSRRSSTRTSRSSSRARSPRSSGPIPTCGSTST